MHLGNFGEKLMKIFCFGNLGYVGTILNDHLESKVEKYIGFDAGYFEKCLVKNCPKIKHQLFGDVRNENNYEFEDFDSVVYLAALSNDPLGKEFGNATKEINCDSAIRIAKKAKALGVKRFVFASSCSIYGKSGESKKKENSKLNPLTEYAKSKIDAERELSKLSCDDFIVTCLRFATACGYSNRLRLDLVLNDFISSAFLNNQIKLLSDGQSWRPLIHVKDMSRAIKWACHRNVENGGNYLSINVGSDSWNYKIIDLAKQISHILGGTKLNFSDKSFNDPRSYVVDFSLFRKLAPNHQPQETLVNTVKKISLVFKKKKDFYRNDFVRLEYLKNLINKGQLSSDLYWE